jgi:hypothetical protein
MRSNGMRMLIFASLVLGVLMGKKSILTRFPSDS